MNAWRAGPTEAADLERAQSRKWLVTNSRGGYASGTTAGCLTRSYHGLLITALAPPVECRLLVAKCELDIRHDGVSHALATNRWAGGIVAPDARTFVTPLVDALDGYGTLGGDFRSMERRRADLARDAT